MRRPTRRVQALAGVLLALLVLAFVLRGRYAQGRVLVGADDEAVSAGLAELPARPADGARG